MITRSFKWTCSCGETINVRLTPSLTKANKESWQILERIKKEQREWDERHPPKEQP